MDNPCAYPLEFTTRDSSGDKFNSDDQRNWNSNWKKIICRALGNRWGNVISSNALRENWYRYDGLNDVCSAVWFYFCSYTTERTASSERMWKLLCKHYANIGWEIMMNVHVEHNRWHGLDWASSVSPILNVILHIYLHFLKAIISQLIVV